jgi:hypothetical protein
MKMKLVVWDMVKAMFLLGAVTIAVGFAIGASMGIMVLLVKYIGGYCG